ncbi:hairy-related 13 [Brachionichthys hirsutus]|uniref:hairy-related 13 n=1 Tax=Brachionichthys hirsutus TaxID=412623 RepID=UPI0036049D84
MEGDELECGLGKADRKIRKPLVEKKRRARINDSLTELRTLLADADLHSKMENAEVLEMTVKRVEELLKNRTQDAGVLSREASERFAAGYIQCMHEVHMFVSTCPGIDATVAAELLNHLLECMPLNEDRLQDVLMDLIADTSGGSSGSVTLLSPGGRGLSSGSSAVLSPAPSVTSSEDVCSDLDETDSEHNQSSSEALACKRSMWRPW